MAKQSINLGTAPEGAGGDSVRTALEKVNANFDEIYSGTSAANAKALNGLSGSNGKVPVFTGAGTMRLADLVGTVGQSSGVPTGAIIEQGSNANGRYVRYADGTQICMNKVTWTQHSGGGAQSAVSVLNAATFVGQVYSFISQNSAWGMSVKCWMEGQNAGGATVYVKNDHTGPLDITIFWLSVGRWY